VWGVLWLLRLFSWRNKVKIRLSKINLKSLQNIPLIYYDYNNLSAKNADMKNELQNKENEIAQLKEKLNKKK
jgi:L-ribulose-5-phosphate 3-epimerase UlaE